MMQSLSVIRVKVRNSRRKKSGHRAKKNQVIEQRKKKESGHRAKHEVRRRDASSISKISSRCGLWEFEVDVKIELASRRRFALLDELKVSFCSMT